MAGYWNRPEATREVLFRTAGSAPVDAACSDPDGYIWIVDRVADRFLSDGRPVYPGDLERVLTAHPSVADATAVQLPSGEGAEAVAALVVLSPGAATTEVALLAFAGQHLAPHQTPASVRFVDHLPRNSVGKLLRSQLRTR